MFTQYIISSKMIQQGTHPVNSANSIIHTPTSIKSGRYKCTTKNNFLSPPHSLPGEGAVTNFCAAFVLLVWLYQTISKMLPELHQCSDFTFFINSLFADLLVSGSTNSKYEEQYQSNEHRRKQQIVSFAQLVMFINKCWFSNMFCLGHLRCETFPSIFIPACSPVRLPVRSDL